MTLAFHYTVGTRISAILEDGAIKLATAFVPAGVKAVVWLTVSPNFEPTARKPLVGYDGRLLRLQSAEEMAEAEGVYRIAVDADRFPMTWRDYRRHSGDSKKMLHHLEVEAARQGSNVSAWRVSFDPIREADWLRIERLHLGAWLVDWEVAG